MNITYSTTVNKDHWHYVLDHADLANTFHTSENTPLSERTIEGYGKFKLSFGAELRDLVRYVNI